MRRGDRPLTGRLVLATALAVLLGGCAGETAAPAPTPSVDAVGLRIDRLHGQVSTIASRRAEVDQRLQATLAGVRRVDEFVVAVRDPDRLDTILGQLDAVAAAFTGAPIDGIRSDLVEVAFTVDEARTTLRSAQQDLAQAWEIAYLDTEDAVLAAVREYAEIADRLAQVLENHAATYTAALDETRAFRDVRSRYRTSQEAADAYELQMRAVFGRLATAQAEIATFRTQREDAATALNAASALAARSWAGRPTAAPGA